MTTAAESTVQTDTVSVSAEEAAAQSQDFGAFREAERAKRAGKPLPEVKVAAPEAESAATPKAAPRTSKRQEKINDAARLAADKATADLREENARLKAEVEAAKAQPERPAPPTTQAVTLPAPDHERYLALPDAPKLEQFGNDVAKHAAAVAVFVNKQIHDEAQRAAATQHAITSAEREVADYQARIAEAGGETHVKALSDEVKQLVPIEYLQWEIATARAQGDTAKATTLERSIGPLHVLQSCIIKSPLAAKLQTYLTAHPEQLKAFETLPDVRAVYVAFGKLERDADSPASSTPPPKTVTSAPHPPQTLSTARNAAPPNPYDAALKDGNFLAVRAMNRDRFKRQTA